MAGYLQVDFDKFENTSIRSLEDIWSASATCKRPHHTFALIFAWMNVDIRSSKISTTISAPSHSLLISTSRKHRQASRHTISDISTAWFHLTCINTQKYVFNNYDLIEIFVEYCLYHISCYIKSKRIDERNLSRGMFCKKTVVCCKTLLRRRCGFSAFQRYASIFMKGLRMSWRGIVEQPTMVLSNDAIFWTKNQR